MYVLKLCLNWKYEFIDITLILTLNDDIVVTLNDLIVILTSTILVNLVITLVHHVSSRQRTIAKYMLVLLYSVYKKKLNRFEIALNFAKQLLVSSF